MIFFQCRPDEIFTEILEGALEMAFDAIREIVSYKEKEIWEKSFPNSSRCFTPRAAASAIQQILSASREKDCYRIQDYHWLLLYDCLESHCELLNDTLGDASFTPSEILAKHDILEIDFEALIDVYFWDTDFLVPPDLAEGLGEDRRNEMGYSNQVFGIAQGWKPHSGELQLERVNPDKHWDPDEPPFFRHGSTRYPDLEAHLEG